jgi:hypothetical protein
MSTFVAIGTGDWFLNLDYVAEVFFKQGERETEARLVARTVDEDENEKFMAYYLSGEAADRLWEVLRRKAE